MALALSYSSSIFEAQGIVGFFGDNFVAVGVGGGQGCWRFEECRFREVHPFSFGSFVAFAEMHFQTKKVENFFEDF